MPHTSEATDIEAVAINPLSEVDVERLAHFAWLLDWDSSRDAIRLAVLWTWAGEMAALQNKANQTGESITYYQRGRPVRVLHPVKEAA